MNEEVKIVTTEITETTEILQDGRIKLEKGNSRREMINGNHYRSFFLISHLDFIRVIREIWWLKR